MTKYKPEEARELAKTIVPRTAIFQNGLGAWSVMLTDVELAKLLSIASANCALENAEQQKSQAVHRVVADTD